MIKIKLKNKIKMPSIQYDGYEHETFATISQDGDTYNTLDFKNFWNMGESLRLNFENMNAYIYTLDGNVTGNLDFNIKDNWFNFQSEEYKYKWLDVEIAISKYLKQL